MTRLAAASSILLGLFVPVSGWAQTASPPACSPGTSFFERIDEQFVGDLADKAARDTPRAAASSTQTTAPSIAGNAATLIDSAGFSNLLSAAFDRSVGTGNADAVTLSLNPFTFAAIRKPSAYYDQTEYERLHYSILRRFAMSASFGGQGDSFDRDGDGKPDPALDSDKFGDIMGWEVRVKLYGNRDRRSRGDWLGPDNFAVFTTATRKALPELMTRKEELLRDGRLPFFKTPGVLLANPNMCMTDDEWKALNAETWFVEALARATDAAVDLNARYATAADTIDNQFLVTLAVTGLERSQKFGPDKVGLGLRATWFGGTFNFDWSQVEGLGSAEDSNEYKVGAKYATQILKGSFWTDGIDASASAAYDHFDNVPDAKHDSNVKVQGRLDIPVTGGMTVPLSVTWANHRDLFDDGDEVFGHIGINFDMAELLAKKDPTVEGDQGQSQASSEGHGQRRNCRRDES